MKLERKDIENINSIEKTIEKAKGKLTLAEISAETGLPLDEANSYLNILMERYSCRVKMDQSNGKLQFNFDYPLKRRDSKSFKEIMLIVLNALWKTFQLVYKASVGLVMIVYTIFFLVVLLLMMSRSDDRDNDAGSLVGGILRAIFEALRFKAIVDLTTEYADDGQFRYKKYSQPKNKGKNFIQSIYHLVFGPDKPKYHPLDNTLEAVSFIRNNNGKLTAGNIIALSGVDYPTAESKLAEYAGKFKGELYIDQSGIVTAEFPQLLHSSNTNLKGGKIEFYKNEVEPPVEFTGNSGGRNVAILAMNTFNLIMSMVAMTMFETTFIGFWAGLFPCLVSLLYFIIPIVRVPFYFSAKSKREYSIMHKQLVGLITDFPKAEFKITDFQRVVNLKQEVLERHLLKICGELEGEVVINNEGKAVYVFQRLSAELN